MTVKNYKKGSKTKLSANFNVSEFACKGNGCCDSVKIDTNLVAYLQQIRDHFKKPVIITSAYRCATHNKNVGGATGSYHTYGEAADIVIEGVKPAEIAKYAESLGILGIGLYETNKDGFFVHVDTRTKKSFWYGQACAYRSTFGGKAPETDSGEYPLTEFVKDVQKVIGAKVDGIAGSETLSKTPTLSRTKNPKHAAVKPVQKRLAALGFDEVGAADGVAGAKFTSAVAHFQQKNACVVDGEITAKGKTWKKLLGLA